MSIEKDPKLVPFTKTNKRSKSLSSEFRGNFAQKTYTKRPSTQQQNKSKKIHKTFDPSQFLKKVEEQVSAPAYIPQHLFTDFAINTQLQENITARGYTTPTPIQDQAIPILLAGQDIIASANTGTGKTAAFLIPLINNVLTQQTTRALIITPTRELADQIQQELTLFTHHLAINSALCIGGVNINPQIQELKKQPSFVIGTPGRLLDLAKNQILRFEHYTSIVLDEVDTMLNMGFINDIKQIISKLPKRRHSLFFSATIPQSLQDIMHSFLKNPITIKVQTRQSAENVNQQIIKVDATNKIEVLHDLLIQQDFRKVIIFLRTKWSTEKLAKALTYRGFKVAAIHGDKTQASRKKSLTLFKDNKVNILLATDVVARGIDINDVSHVINYDLPQSYEDYIHRIGRTGRADKIGQAITFIEQ